MNENIITQMREKVSEIMTCFQTDFENYDRAYIEEATEDKFPLIWVIGKSHTYLIKLGEVREKFGVYESLRYGYAQDNVGMFAHYFNQSKDDRYFLITPDKIEEKSKAQSLEIIRDVTYNTAKKWISENGALPSDFKMKVKFRNITLSKLRELIRECEEHGDDSLLRQLKDFRHYRKLADDHYIEVTYYEACNEFGFAVMHNGKPDLVGGIIFHGWPETGYKTNGSVQLSPRYGWSKHT